MQYENESTKIMEENLGEVPEYEVEEILSVRISEKTNEVHSFNFFKLDTNKK